VLLGAYWSLAPTGKLLGRRRRINLDHPVVREFHCIKFCFLKRMPSISDCFITYFFYNNSISRECRTFVTRFLARAQGLRRASITVRATAATDRASWKQTGATSLNSCNMGRKQSRSPNPCSLDPHLDISLDGKKIQGLN
jgi:hypothetical protein